MTFLAGTLGFFATLQLLARLGVRPPLLATVRDRARAAIAPMFVLSGSLHLLTPDAFLAMMPPTLPSPEALVVLSGVAEIAGGLGLLLPATRRLATYGLLALLLAVFPANLWVAFSGGSSATGLQADWYPWVRLLFQPLYLAWLWWTLPPRPERALHRDRPDVRTVTSPPRTLGSPPPPSAGRSE
jgi:uncharacterized membrane protein